MESQSAETNLLTAFLVLYMGVAVLEAQQAFFPFPGIVVKAAQKKATKSVWKLNAEFLAEIL